MDMFGIMGKLGDLKKAAEEAKKKLAGMTVEATSSDGSIKVICFANKQVKDISFLAGDEETALTPMNNSALIQTLNEALNKADELTKSEMKKATSGLIPNIPGLDLSQFGL